MRLLLDTHAFLWFVLNDPNLSATARVAISNPTNEVLISPVTYWEIAIKIATKRYSLNSPYQQFMEDQIAINRFVILPIEPRHAAATIPLPFHHRDPFDRLLVAQAVVEGITLVTCDQDIVKYPVPCLW